MLQRPERGGGERKGEGKRGRGGTKGERERGSLFLQVKMGKHHFGSKLLAIIWSNLNCCFLKVEIEVPPPRKP